MIDFFSNKVLLKLKLKMMKSNDERFDERAATTCFYWLVNLTVFIDFNWFYDIVVPILSIMDPMLTFN